VDEEINIVIINSIKKWLFMLFDKFKVLEENKEKQGIQNKSSR
jgi:hypothetical protein